MLRKFHVRLTLFITFLLSVFVLVPFSVNAVVIENTVTEEYHEFSEDIDDDLTIFGGERVLVSGDVNGDLMVTAGWVDVTGDVEGDMYIAGGKVTAENLVGGNIFIVGGDILVDTESGGSAFLAGGNISVGGNIGQDLNATGGKVFVDARVGDDARLAGGQIEVREDIAEDLIITAGLSDITGNVGGDLILVGGENTVNSQTIGGDLVTYGDGNYRVNENIEITGEKRSEEFETAPTYDDVFSQWDWTASLGVGLWLKAIYALFQGIGLVIVGYLLFKFAPIRLDSTLDRMRDSEEFLKSSLVGFLAFPVGLLLAIILIISVFGWPILKLFVILFALAMALVTPIAGLLLGEMIMHAFNADKHHVMALVIGIMLVQLLRVLPIIGWIISFFLTIAVIGAMLRMQWGKYKIAQNLHLRTKK